MDVNVDDEWLGEVCRIAEQDESVYDPDEEEDWRDELRRMFLDERVWDEIIEAQDEAADGRQVDIALMLASSDRRDRAFGRAGQDARGRTKAERQSKIQDRRDARDELADQERAAVMNIMVPDCYGYAPGSSSVPSDYHGRASLAETAATVLYGRFYSSDQLDFVREHIDEVADVLLDRSVGEELLRRAAPYLSDLSGDRQADDYDSAWPDTWPDRWDADIVRSKIAHRYCPELPEELWMLQSWRILRDCWQAEKDMREWED